jgi:hypothetical protein
VESYSTAFCNSLHYYGVHLSCLCHLTVGFAKGTRRANIGRCRFEKCGGGVNLQSTEPLRRSYPPESFTGNCRAVF